MSGATRRDRGKLGGIRRREVVRLLAAQDVSQVEIARRYDVSESAVTQFKHRYLDEIEAVRKDMDAEFAGLAIADKAARLATYQELLDVALERTPKTDIKGNVIFDPETGEPVYEIDSGAAARVLKQAAEELGQLPTRLQVQGDLEVRTRYEIAGLDPDALK